MLVVIASQQDQVAHALVSQWAAHGTGLLTCADLSTSGWRHHLSTTGCPTAVVGGQEVAVEEITGVLTRLPCMFEHELVDIVPDDRPYVAMEMTAFLLAWLSSLRCPVLNRPTSTCLSGPYWRRERWIAAAAQVGMPVRPLHRRAALSNGIPAESPDPLAVTVTVVGQRWFGAVDAALAAQARHLADFAGVDLLTVQFSCPEAGAYFISANAWPDIEAAGMADVILEYLLRM